MFEPITLNWEGRDYIIPADQVMRAICVIEDHITVQQLLRPDAVPMGKLAMAYTALLRFAGATKVREAEVYSAILGDGNAAVAATQALVMMMIPPEHLRAKGEVKGKAKAAKASSEAQG